MRSFPLFFLVLFLIAVLQGSFRHFPHPALPLDVMWLGLLFLGFYVPILPGALIALLLAFVQEAWGAPLHGVLALSYLAVYFFLRLTHQHIFFQRRTSQVIWVALLSLAYRGIEAGLLVWQGYEVPTGGGRLAAWAFLEGFASLAVFPLFRLGLKAPEALSQSRRKRFTLDEYQ